MKTIKITCDRCGAEVEGMIGISNGTVTTAGYYIVAEGSWKEYQRDDEEYICDECMHSDPQYKKLYLQE